jgi:transitional endoplasmic reticulum ATPase
VRKLAENPKLRMSSNPPLGASSTGKTTFVENVAEALGWPLVTLSPPNFLSRGGLDGFEAAADEIFRDLTRLRRAVVFFDECEDFFKRRRPKAKPRAGRNGDLEERPESRTIGAFITAGMLPRLQQLHRRKWVLFFVATNSTIDALDAAVVRPGRFDFQQDVRHPELGAQLAYVAATPTSSGASWLSPIWTAIPCRSRCSESL